MSTTTVHSFSFKWKKAQEIFQFLRFYIILCPLGDRTSHLICIIKIFNNSETMSAITILKANTILHLFFFNRAPVAHLVVHWAVTWEVVSLKLRPDQYLGSLNNCGEKCCLCNFRCKWLDFLVFSDKDDKAELPSHNSLNVDNSVGC